MTISGTETSGKISYIDIEMPQQPDSPSFSGMTLENSPERPRSFFRWQNGARVMGVLGAAAGVGIIVAGNLVDSESEHGEMVADVIGGAFVVSGATVFSVITALRRMGRLS